MSSHILRRTALIVVCLLAMMASAVFAQTYTFKNVKIVAGGFITGIVASHQSPNVMYTRTDIGGLYRWNEATQSWIPLTDWVGQNNWGYQGVTSVAIDPSNDNIVYAAVGMYTNSWDPNNGAVMKSADRGATWTITPLPFKNGGNMPGRGNGERLAVDPNNGNVIYYGAPGNATEAFGLWRSTDGNASWSKVTSFTAQGDYSDLTVAEDQFDYQSHKMGIFWVVFDPRTTINGVSQNIYVGVATRNGPTIWRSTDGGSTWAAVSGQPLVDCGGNPLLPTKAEFEPVGGNLFITYGNMAGPYEDPIGEVFKYNTGTGAWTNISPVANACVAVGADGQAPYYGYNGLSICKSNPNIMMVTGHSSWWPDTYIFRSTNGGQTWTNLWHWTSYPNRSYEYVANSSGGVANVSEAPWLAWAPTQKCRSGGRPGPDPQPKVGWMTAALEIDPFNPSRFFYGTGAMLYGVSDAHLWDDSNLSTQFNIRVKGIGIEEVNCNTVVSPPTGTAHLVTALWDIKGFVHDNLDVVPPQMHDNINNPDEIDFAQNAPLKWVSVEPPNSNECRTAIGFSSDGAYNWVKTTSDPAGVTGAGKIAYNAAGTIVVWSPVGPATSYRSTNPGSSSSSWSAISSLPSGAMVRSDRVNANKFYAFKNGTFYVSTDGGATFTATVTSGLPTSEVKFKVSYAAEGDIWLVSRDSTNGGVWRSTNSGASFTKLSSVVLAQSVGFGKAATGQTVPTIFIEGQVGTVRGYFRSTDAGATWVRINDDAHQWGNSGYDISGDPRIFGRVYIATNGRGVIYGDEGATSGSPPAAPSNLTATAASSSQINLGWTDNSTNETAFIIERATDSTFTQNLSTATVGANVTSYQATGLTASTTYYFRVKAGNEYGNSAYSNTASATTQSSGLGTTCHVSSIVCTTVGGGTSIRGQAQVTVRDNLGNPVPNATVTGNFTGSYNESGKSAVTNSSGVATIQTSGTNRGNISFTFCVTNITHASLTYNSSANVVTCASN